MLKHADQVWMKEKEERKVITDELCMQVFVKLAFKQLRSLRR